MTTLLDQMLAANAAVADGRPAPMPVIGEGRRIVIVTCGEVLGAPRCRDLAALLGLSSAEVLVLANAGARIHDAAGDVVRGVAGAIARGEGGEVLVVAHEDCAFLPADPESLAATFPSASATMLDAIAKLCGDSYVSARKLVLSSAQVLRGSPYLPPATPVHALLLAVATGRLAVEESGYGRGAAASFGDERLAGLGPMPSPLLVAPGPSSLLVSPPPSFGAAEPSFLAAPTPSSTAFLAASQASQASALSGAADLLAAAQRLDVAPPTFVPPPNRPALVFEELPKAASPAPVLTVPPPAEAPPPPPAVPAPPEKRPLPPPKNVDEAFRRANEVLERLRQERRKR